MVYEARKSNTEAIDRETNMNRTIDSFSSSINHSEDGQSWKVKYRRKQV